MEGIRTLGISSGASAPEVLVEQIIDAFAERYDVEVETVAAVEENMFFPLPRPLRGMNVDAAYQFPRDTTAKILTSGILGEQYIGLEAGGDGVMLKNGDRVRLTQSAVVLENLISQFLFNKAAEGKDEKK